MIDYTREDFTNLHEQFDVVFDVVPNRSFPECRRLLTAQGIYLTTLPGPGPCLWRVATRLARVVGYRKRCWWVMLRSNREGLDDLAGLVADGRLRPAIGQTFGLDDAPAAHRFSESGHARGKIVIVVPQRDSGPAAG